MKFGAVSKLATAVLALALAGTIAHGQEVRPLAVVELFTSQGCNSCPPADEFVAELAHEGDVVALAYHVDYWDYLGWRDTLASPDNTARQKEYSTAFGTRSVYTPQAVINGRTHVNGAKRGKVEMAMARLAADGEGMQVDVTATRQGDTMVIETGASDGVAGEAHVVLVYFRGPVPVEIVQGENKGRTLTYFNSVSQFHSAGMWHGKPTRIELPISEINKKGEGGCAVLIQEMGEGGLPGAILGATIIRRQGDS
jgi:hypothetical protein